MSSLFPHECRGFFSGKHTRLVGVWGSYAFKSAGVLSDIIYSPGGHGLWTPTHDLQMVLWDPVRGGQVNSFPLSPPGQDQDNSVPTFGAVMQYLRSGRTGPQRLNPRRSPSVSWPHRAGWR